MTSSHVSHPSHAYCAAQGTNMSNMDININNIISEPSVFTRHYPYSADKYIIFIIEFTFIILVCLVLGIGFNIYHVYEEYEHTKLENINYENDEEEEEEEHVIEEQVPSIVAARCPCWVEDDEGEYTEEEEDEYSEEDDETYDKSYEPSESDDSEDDDY